MPIYNPRNGFIKKKFLFLFLLLLGTVTTFIVFFKRNPLADVKLNPINLPNVVVHIDLKGSPPKISYLESLLPLLKDYGVNGLLMEYEDMFPYTEDLEVVRAKNAYTKQDIIDFHKNIVPLKHLHVGCDEVYHLNECGKCKKQKNSNKIKTFTKHVEFVKNTVHKLTPGTKVLIWDDMMRGHNGRMNQMNIKEINKNLEPVYWDYTDTLRIYHPDMVRYQISFENVWVASAFKGADGRVATIPDQKKRIANHASWLQMIARYGEGYPSYKFKGIILTGWSRVSNLDPPMETLQVSLQTLLQNLLLIQKYKQGYTFKKRIIDDLIKAYDDTLDCDKQTMSMKLRCDSEKLLSTFTSLEICRKEALEHIYGDEHGLYAIEYYKDNINMNSAPNIVSWAVKTKNYLSYLQATARKIMNDAYDNDFVDEYLSLKVHAIVEKLNTILNIVKKYQQRRIWGERKLLIRDINITNSYGIEPLDIDDMIHA